MTATAGHAYTRTTCSARAGGTTGAGVASDVDHDTSRATGSNRRVPTTPQKESA